MLQQRTRLSDLDPVQRAARRIYDARGVKGLAAACVAFDVVVSLATAALSSAFARRYFHVSVSDYAVILAISLPTIAAGVLVVAYLERGRYRSVLSWQGEGRIPERAPAVWRLAAGLPRALAVRLAAWVAIGVVPVTALNIIVVLPLRDGIACMLAGLTLSATAISLMVFGTELALRPVLEDIARYLPEDFEPPAQSARLRLTMATPLVAVSLTCAITVAAYADLVSSGPWRMVLSFGIGIVSLLIGGTVIWAVVRSLRNPVDELLEATKRVRAGDLSTPVPIVTDDELGTVSSGFNRMLVELRRHERELRESRARVVAAADAARRKVERDLHDGAQQQLVVVGLKLGMARQLVERDPPAAAAVLAELKDDLDRALAELRDLAHGLYPQLLESEGLSAALGDAAGRAAITTEVNADGAGRYPAEVEAAVYFCCLEALQNAGKHAGPGARASVTLAEEAGALRFEVADDGRGFESSNGRPAGAGLANMADRIAALGGELRVSSRAGSGTTISGRIPLRPG